MTDNYRSQEVAVPVQTQTTWWQYMKAYMKVRITEPVGIRMSESKVSIMTKLIAVCCLFIYAPTAYYASIATNAVYLEIVSWIFLLVFLVTMIVGAIVTHECKLGGKFYGSLFIATAPCLTIFFLSFLHVGELQLRDAKLCEAYKDLGWTAESEALGCLEEAKEEDDEGTKEE